VAELSAREGDRLIVLGAIGLFVSLVFVNWYGGTTAISSVPGLDVGGEFSRSGWQAFTSSRWVWLAAVLLALLSAAFTSGAGGPYAQLARSFVALLGTLSAVLIAYRIAHHRPDVPVGEETFHTAGAIRLGIGLALAAAGAVTVGACLALVGSSRSAAGVDPPGAGS
jgi:hypothetical protein